VRFTIERLRTLVLAAGVLLIAALIAFLARGKLKNPFSLGGLPQHLPAGIQMDETGFTYSHAMGAHAQFKIHASKAVQFKDNHAELHDVKIELYGEDGSRVDRIEGARFDYDQKNQTATATGPVEITLMRPSVAPAVAPKASTAPALGKPQSKSQPKSPPKPLASVAEAASRGEIHVKTSGLVFDQKTGVATTDQHVDFSMVQGTGSSMGASYNSQQGHLVLDRSVELNTVRSGERVVLHAQHAEFERGDKTCNMHVATANYRDGEASAGDAKILFREDGSAVRLDAINGFSMTTAAGAHIAAPTGQMDFNEDNQPRHGHMEGGVQMDSTRSFDGGLRQVHGSAPSAEIEFTRQGALRHTHLERGVQFQSHDQRQTTDGLLHIRRTWNSPVADVDFRDNGHGQAEPVTIHGVQGVVVTSETQRGKAPAVPSRLAADELTGDFGPNSTLTAMTGAGHASMEETTATGTRQSSSGDRVEAHFAPPDKNAKAVAKQAAGTEAQIQSAVLDGHVILNQEPAAKPGFPPAAPLHAWAGHAVYEGAGEWLHLTLSPRVDNGGLQLTADKIDVSRESGDAFAHGNVKATWSNDSSGQQSKSSPAQPGQGIAGLGGGPSHVVSAEAQLHQATGEATFRGHARLWQQANSVTGPVIVLDRQRQTLVAHSADPAEPVRAVLLSANGGDKPSSSGKPAAPAVIRVHGGDLKYSDAEHKALMRAGSLGPVVAETGAAASSSNEVELLLLPPGNHAGKDGASTQVDRMIARGHVVLTSQDRHGVGEQLVYTGETGEYVLTGTAGAPPRMTDPQRGSVTGEALIFLSREDKVTVEGGGRGTSTDTRAPK
jgi:lipopolysaccharide export system protein LptA